MKINISRNPSPPTQSEIETEKGKYVRGMKKSDAMLWVSGICAVLTMIGAVIINNKILDGLDDNLMLMLFMTIAFIMFGCIFFTTSVNLSIYTKRFDAIELQSYLSISHFMYDPLLKEYILAVKSQKRELIVAEYKELEKAWMHPENKHLKLRMDELKKNIDIELKEQDIYDAVHGTS